MMISEDKISHLSHVLFNALDERGLIDYEEGEEGAIRREMKRAITAELKVGDEIDQFVRKKVLSLSKKVIEGSPEWEVLYRKYFREEEVRRGRASG